MYRGCRSFCTSLFRNKMKTMKGVMVLYSFPCPSFPYPSPHSPTFPWSSILYSFLYPSLYTLPITFPIPYSFTWNQNLITCFKQYIKDSDMTKTLTHIMTSHFRLSVPSRSKRYTHVCWSWSQNWNYMQLYVKTTSS